MIAIKARAEMDSPALAQANAQKYPELLPSLPQ